MIVSVKSVLQCLLKCDSISISDKNELEAALKYLNQAAETNLVSDSAFVKCLIG